MKKFHDCATSASAKSDESSSNALALGDPQLAWTLLKSIVTPKRQIVLARPTE
jgi:hypothetical protein